MNNVRLFFAGDFCSKPSTSRITVSDELKNLIQSCDLKVVNFEVPLKPDISLPPQQYERFWQHDDVPDFLKDLGFNLFSIANNHAFDWGIEGFRKTKNALGEASFGAGTYDEAYRIKVCEINGIKIGLFALSYAAYTGVFDDVLHQDGIKCAYINDLRVNHDIMEAKKNVDYLFVLPHAGIEYIDVPLPELVARYRDFIDYGADGVIATHPHCPQGWEKYKGKPIFYSIGNFLFNSKDGYDYRAWNRPHWYEGICVLLTVSNDQLSWEVVNTRNVDNTGIIIDNDIERKHHNDYLCNLLISNEQYLDVLTKECKRLAETEEMPILDRTKHVKSLKIEIKESIKTWLKIIRKQQLSDDFHVKTLLKDEVRRNCLLRGIEND